MEDTILSIYNSPFSIFKSPFISLVAALLLLASENLIFSVILFIIFGIELGMILYLDDKLSILQNKLGDPDKKREFIDTTHLNIIITLVFMFFNILVVIPAAGYGIYKLKRKLNKVSPTPINNSSVQKAVGGRRRR